MKKTRLISYILCLLAAITAADISAFTPDTYSKSSILSDGKWVKIGVESSGIKFISARELKQIGFSDPTKVKICGYGGRQISDILSAENYVDDLPEVGALRTPAGVWFYGVGPETWSEDADGRLTRSLNAYSSEGYYFLSESPEPKSLTIEGEASIRPNAINEANAAVVHEVDKISYSSSGQLLLGEDMRLTPTRTFDFQLPDRKKGSEVWMKCEIATHTTAQSRLHISADGQVISPTEGAYLRAVVQAEYGVLTPVEATYFPAADANKTSLTLKFSGGGLTHWANLDAITLNYLRQLSLSSGEVEFSVNSTAVKINDTGGKEVVVWDVTDPLNPIAMNIKQADDGSIGWVSPFTGRRHYVAWRMDASLPSADSHSAISTQNLHALIAPNAAETPEMIIFHAPGLRAQAEKIASLHRDIDGMKVIVANQEEVFNEFASGVADPGAFRRMLKMAYDCSGGKLKYTLMLGRGWFDNRALTSTVPFDRAYRMPVWQSEQTLHEYTTYTTDDYFAFLDDNSGLRPQSDRYCIAVGRIPSRSASEADAYISKLEKYMKSASDGEWRNKVILLADDGDFGIHLQHSEDQVEKFLSTDFGAEMLMEKVYIDTWPLKGGVCEEGRTRLHKLLDDGAVWWNYVGHANKYYLSGQGVMTLSDITNMANRKWPVFFGATCYFMQWDGPEQSGAEKLLFNRNGGVIAAISSTRPAFISENGLLGKAVSEQAFRADADGRQQTIGMTMVNAKNSLASPGGTSNTNKLRYVVMGDPALRPAVGERRVLITAIDGINPDSDSAEIILPGRHTANIEGVITGLDGNIDSEFNGSISATLYDAEESILTLGRDIDGTKGHPVVYEQHGERLSLSADTVIGGRWRMQLTVPEDIADNFRPATLSLSARAASSNNHASGASSKLYVSGIDLSQPADTVAPVIETIYLDNPRFVSGNRVGASPMLIAKVTDNVGISLSSAGVGRQMSLRLDGNHTYSDVASYFTPLSDGKPGGEIAYPLSELSDGRHTLQLTVFDTSGNMARQTIDFIVDSQLAPEILDIYTDASPASVEANFYITHNRPEARLTVCVTVYNLLGHMVWSSTVTDRSDMTTSAPVKWNLTDRAGNRVPRGIYIYRAEIINGKSRTVSPAKKIAVAAP